MLAPYIDSVAECDNRWHKVELLTFVYSMLDFAIIPHASFLTLHHLALPLYFEDHILFVAQKLVFCWTSVIDLLPMAWFVGPMLNGADVLPFVQFFAFIMLDADHQKSVRA